MLISWQNLSKQFFVKISLQWFLLFKKNNDVIMLMLLIFHLNERLWRLKSILDTSKNFKSFLLNKSSVIKEILKHYIDGRLPFPHSLYQPRVVFKRGSCWMVYRYCQFTFQTCALRDCQIEKILYNLLRMGDWHGKESDSLWCHKAGFILSYVLQYLIFYDNNLISSFT